MRLFLIQMNPTVGDFDGNTQKILQGMEKARMNSCDFVLTPEMSICGYPSDDFLLLHTFIEEAQNKLEEIIAASEGLTVVVGLPRYHKAKREKGLYNSAAIIQNRSLLGFQDKTLLPTYDVFDESRYFDSAVNRQVWNILGKKIGVTVCEDIWQHSELVKFTTYQDDPIHEYKENLDFLINISASPFSRKKLEKRINACSKAAKTLKCPIILCNQVGGNDSLIFDGNSFYVDHQGVLLGKAKGFEEDTLIVDLDHPPPSIIFKRNEIEDIYHALVLGLRDYFIKSNFSKALIGLSGGIDSALVACIAAQALGKENVLTVSLPSRFSSESSITDAKQLAENLEIDLWEMPIEKPFQCFLDLLDPFFSGRPFDVAEENIQARIRGMILMAISNKFGRIVLSTGNKSELAMGYSTLYGDMCGGLGVISDVTKLEVYDIARWINLDREIIPKNMISKPPSAELKPNQKDSDSLPDYQIVDRVLKDYVEEHLTPFEIASKHCYPKEIVDDLIKRIHVNEYKRRQSAPGLRISEKSFSVGYRFPIVQRFR